MTVTTGPTEINPTHHVKLTDGTDTVGLVLVDGYGRPDIRGFQRNLIGAPIKIMQGDSKYSDSPPPWDNIEMKDFSGGFGSRDFDNDKSKYYWGLRAYTHNGKFLVGPQPVWTGGLYKHWPHEFSGYIWQELTNTNPYLAVQFTTTATTDIDYIHFVAKGTVTNLDVAIYSDSGGSPNAIVGTGADVTTGTETGEHVITIASGALSNATAYWVVFHTSTLSATQTVHILCSYGGYPTCKYGTAVPAWTAIDRTGPFYVAGKRYGDLKNFFFEYKGAWFAALQFDAGTTSYLFVNGDQGVVKAGGSTSAVTLDSGIATWAADEAVGSVMIIRAGTGSTQPRNFRVIEDNDLTGTTAAGDTVFSFTSDPWDVAPDATSEVAIVASNKWTAITPDITGTNPWTDKPVTSVLSVNDAVYFAHGDANDMTRMRIYNSTGTWTKEWNVEAADSEATYLAAAADPSGGYIWKLKGGTPAKIAKAPALDASGTGAVADLTWGTEISVGDTGARITNGLEYGEDYGQLHVLKENGLFKVNLASDDTDYITRIPISGLPPSKDWRNGRAAVVHDTYLFISWHDTIMRYYRNYLDNIGPNSQECSMPDDYRGVVSSMVSYPGMLIASIDAGDSGYSTVNAYNGSGWCNLFTAPKAGLRIQNIAVQSIPGDNVDRLWISCADTSLWIPISVNPAEFPSTTYNQYNQAWSARIDMGMMYAGRRRLSKYWNRFYWYMTTGYYGFTSVASPYYKYRVKITDAGLFTSGIVTLSEEYDSETDSGWDLDMGGTGYAIMPRITVEMDDPSVYTTIDSMIFEALTMDKARWSSALTVRVADRDKDLGGDFDDYLTADAKLAKLTTWAETTPTKLTMTSTVGVMDTKSVMIVPDSIRLISVKQDDMTTSYIMRIQVYEV
jgi:hypothetical protein